LRVVDGDQNALVARDSSKQLGQSDGDRPLLGRFARRLLQHERDAERASLRLRQLGDLVVQRREEVHEGSEGELTLRRSRPCLEHPEAPLLRVVDGRAPQRRLPDPGLALEDEDVRRGAIACEKVVEPRQILVAADQGRRRRGHLPLKMTEAPEGEKGVGKNQLVADGNRMIFLGFGKYARADRIYALEPLGEGERGHGRRTRVWVEGVSEPIIASRTERTILHEMGQEAAASSVIVDQAIDLAERLAEQTQAGRVDLTDLGRRARRLLEATAKPEQNKLF
jgi:hypothetical protein